MKWLRRSAACAIMLLIGLANSMDMVSKIAIMKIKYRWKMINFKISSPSVRRLEDKISTRDAKERVNSRAICLANGPLPIPLVLQLFRGPHPDLHFRHHAVVPRGQDPAHGHRDCSSLYHEHRFPGGAIQERGCSHLELVSCQVGNRCETESIIRFPSSISFQTRSVAIHNVRPLGGSHSGSFAFGSTRKLKLEDKEGVEICAPS